MTATDYSMTPADQRRLREAALDLLDANWPDEMSTNEIAEHFELVPFQRGAYLWRQLDWLARRGIIQRINRPGYYCRFWRMIQDGDR